MTTGQKIQALRKGRGLTQEQLAARLGVSRQAVSRWELDETLPDTQNLLPLKEALGVSIDTLLDSTRGLEEPAPRQGPPLARLLPPPGLPWGRCSSGGFGCCSCLWSWCFLSRWLCGGWARRPPWRSFS